MNHEVVMITIIKLRVIKAQSKQLQNDLASKMTQFQSRNLSTSSARSIILWMHADDAMKALKCMSVGFQSMERGS